MKYKNAFLLTDEVELVEQGMKRGVAEFTVATRFPHRFEGIEGVTAYKCVYSKEDVCSYPRYALMTLMDEEAVDKVIEAVYKEKAELIVATAYSLDETGTIEVRYHLSPVQLLHKLGLLDNTTIVGGVHLDRDDIDLMAQSNAKVVLCPTASMGYGYGFPHYCALKRKLTVSLGSGDNRFNRLGDMKKEAEILVLGSNCDMRSDHSVREEEALALVSVDGKADGTLFE